VEYFGAKSNLSKSSFMEIARSGIAKSSIKNGVTKSGTINKVNALDPEGNLNRISIVNSFRIS
jgi:hypothetical protein